MSEFFLELFSEEIPVNLQKNAREVLLQNFKDFFEKENIIFSGKGLSFSTPNRLLILFNKINNTPILNPGDTVEFKNISKKEFIKNENRN